jgi:hypothetical protein
MKNAIVLLAIAALALGLAGSAFAYEGGTKLVATMTQPERGEAAYGPITLVPYDSLTGSKPVVEFLRQIPEPTLAVARLREEKPGRSTGTKEVVLFQKGE